MAGANIMIEGTYMGAATDLEGYYVILNVPPRVYDVKVMMIGYTTVRSTGARVSIDFTTKLDFQLRQAVLEGEEVSVIASRPIVRKDLTSSLSIVGSEELEEMTVEEFLAILALQAGIVVGMCGAVTVRGCPSLSCATKRGITEPREAMTFPYRVAHSSVSSSSSVRAFATMTFSIKAFV